MTDEDQALSLNSALVYGVSYTSPVPIRAYVDPYHHCMVTIEQEHSKIHQGKGYTVGSKFTVAEGGGIIEFLCVVQAGLYPHFRSMVVSLDGGPFDIDFYEGTTVSANGTAVTPKNNDRNSSNTAGLAIYDSPTITADGTLLEPILVPASKKIGAIGSDASNEWILKPSTNYMVRVTNNTAGSGTSNGSINMFWYEG